jgi:hypothetical protein
MDAMDWSTGVDVCYKVGEDFFGNYQYGPRYLAVSIFSSQNGRKPLKKSNTFLRKHF